VKDPTRFPGIEHVSVGPVEEHSQPKLLPPTEAVVFSDDHTDTPPEGCVLQDVVFGTLTIKLEHINVVGPDPFQNIFQCDGRKGAGIMPVSITRLTRSCAENSNGDDNGPAGALAVGPHCTRHE